MKIQIQHRFNASVLFEIETNNMRLAIEAAVKSGADLGGADLGGADLGGADLGGAKITNDITIQKAPIQVIGLTWDVYIFDAHMKIGCELHSHDEWRNFSEADWIRMGGKEAAVFKTKHAAALLVLCKMHAED